MGKISSINGYDLYDAESRSIANEAKTTAQAAAAKIPAGGNAGQVLTKTEEGLEWKDISAPTGSGSVGTASIDDTGNLTFSGVDSNTVTIDNTGNLTFGGGN